MNKTILFFLMPFIVSCSFSIFSIVDGETTVLGKPILGKSVYGPIETFSVYSDSKPTKKYKVIGKIKARAYLLKVGINEAKKRALRIGADAVINIQYERHFVSKYFLDLYIITADAVVWK